MDITERIGKLLIQAERTNNEAEQNAFFEKAQKLASTYSVELEKARQAIAHHEKREDPINKRIQIGEPKKPLNAVFCSLMMEIGRAQDIKFNIAHNSTYVIAFGFPSDISVMEAMFAHISHQMVEMANAFIKAGEWRNDKTWDEKTWSWKPTHARVARRCFYEAFIERIGFRLAKAKREAERELQEKDTADHVAAEAGTALVLVKKREEVDGFYAKTSTARGSWRGGNNTYTSTTGSSSGRAAGDRARLGGQQSLPGARKQLG
jgi:hypothetical protein